MQHDIDGSEQGRLSSEQRTLISRRCWIFENVCQIQRQRKPECSSQPTSQKRVSSVREIFKIYGDAVPHEDKNDEGLVLQ
jgi:hypothetical protein